ncbi:TlpA family protein disulfide reductase [uncultured Jatrophihabitans sp.]|uniref:TlpA family protein disulfide reductase n=1 Tax=uncultured Jatrophihabitans sp. TaxID=1610747 RepID=UPI0035C978DF
MMLEDSLTATLQDYEALAPDAQEVLRWLEDHTAKKQPHNRTRILAGACVALLIVAVAVATSLVHRPSTGPTRVGALPSGGPGSTSPLSTAPTILPFRFTKDTPPGTLIQPNLRRSAGALNVQLLATPEKSFDLASVRNQVAVLTWSASWCGPCRTSYTESLTAAGFPPGVQRVTIAVKDNRAGAAALFSAKAAKGPIAYDQTGSTLASLGGLPQVLPLTVLIDRQHRVAAVYTDPSAEMLAHMASALTNE